MPTPLFSIVTPVYRPQARDLQETIDSVVNQSFADWELILVDDASGDPHVTTVMKSAASADSRVVLVERKTNGHIVAASNDGLARARGRWIVLLDHDDLLAPTSLEKIAGAIEKCPTAGYVYTDEDKIDDHGNLSGEFRKPDWSPERLRHQMYLGHLSALRSDLVAQVGGFHTGFDGSQDHDLALRVTELCDDVVHIPEVLYHWRIVPGSAAGDPNAKDYATEAGIRAVQEHLGRMGRPNDTVSVTRVAHTYRTHRVLDDSTLVSVVIPTRGSSGLAWGQQRCFLVEAVRSLLAHTRHDLLEIVVVHDLDTPRSAIDEVKTLCGEHLRLVPYEAPFNFSDKCNRGYLAAAGDMIVFLNDDIEVRSDEFIEQLCAPLEEPSVGMTGARLTFSDDTIQHAGLVFLQSNFVHAYSGVPDNDFGYFGELLVDREVSGLTAACVALRREVVDEVGAFNLGLPNNFNDVDLSYKVRSIGYRLVWLSEVKATHFESRSRVTRVRSREVDTVLSRWGTDESDPYMPIEGARLIERIRQLEKCTD
ncbi:MAG: glycosyltransferase [Actinomyces sp.]|jgi:glycosyltransferase involved in cell wall biosynthesis|nr:glycosyltransferase [Actinomyces sp.]MCI1788859.1 glycosyltransferase [Actinomyces sp.]MCI1829533.1 glycosyltransferase [Actinomyces sp.]